MQPVVKTALKLREVALDPSPQLTEHLDAGACGARALLGEMAPDFKGTDSNGEVAEMLAASYI